MKLFISYAHRDEPFRQELERHLAPLMRQGLITSWNDREIPPGGHVDHVIRRELEEAEIVVFLVSSDFLFSNYCYEVEMARAMERHSRGETVVVPVIARPCDWQRAPFGQLLALPRDGQPISTAADRDRAFLEVVTGIRTIAEGQSPHAVTAPVGERTEERREGRVLRRGSTWIRPQHSDFDKDRFLESSFEQIREFFKASVAELERASPTVRARLRELDGRRFTGTAFRDGSRVAGCAIWIGTRATFSNALCYADSDAGETNAVNELLYVDVQSDALCLKASGMPMFGGAAERRMSPEVAGEYLWELFLRPLRTR